MPYPTTLALALWIPLCVAAFGIMRPPKAALVAFLGGTLPLPEGAGFDVSGLPPVGKVAIASLGALAGCCAFRSRELFRARPGFGLEAVVLLTIPFCLLTVLANRDPIGVNPQMPRLRLWDAGGMVFEDLMLLGIAPPATMADLAKGRAASARSGEAELG